MATILVIEPEAATRGRLAARLRAAGYGVTTARNIASGLRRAQEAAPDLAIMSVTSPARNSLAVCRRLRSIADIPIILLTDTLSEAERIAALDAGADDYLTEPFGWGELLARVRALLRRRPATRDAAPRRRLQAGDLVIDLVAHRALRGPAELHLAPKEFALLAELMRHAGTVLSHEHLLANVWGPQKTGNRQTLGMHIRWLRQKIGDDLAAPRRIVTLRGQGYRFDG